MHYKIQANLAKRMRCASNSQVQLPQIIADQVRFLKSGRKIEHYHRQFRQSERVSIIVDRQRHADCI